MSEKPLLFLDLNGVTRSEPLGEYTESLTPENFLDQVHATNFDSIPLTSGPTHRVKDSKTNSPVLAELGSVLINEKGEKIIINPFGENGLERLHWIRQNNPHVNILQLANLVRQKELLSCVYGFFSCEQDDRLSRILYERQVIIVPPNYFDSIVQTESVAVILISDQKLVIPSNVNQKNKDYGLYETLVYPENVSKIGNAARYLKAQNRTSISFFVDNQGINLQSSSDTSTLTKIGILNTGLINFVQDSISQTETQITESKHDRLTKQSLLVKLKNLQSTLKQWLTNDLELIKMQNNGEIILFSSRQDFLDKLDYLREITINC